MNEIETRQILAMVAAAYPTASFNQHTFRLWYVTFRQEPVDAVKRALFAHIQQSKWPPTISEMRQCLTDQADEFQIDAGEAFGMVLEAVARHGYYRENEALNSLPPSVATAAKRIGWKNICMSENQEALRAHFFRVFDALSVKEKKRELMNIGFNAAALLENK